MKKKIKMKHGTYKILRENNRVFKELCVPHNNDRRRTRSKYLFKYLSKVNIFDYIDLKLKENNND